MLQVVIRGTYYKENSRFSQYNSRQKKNFVYFYDYDDVVKYIINCLSYSELGRLRINIYNVFHDLVKFTAFGEVDLNGNKFEGYYIDSPIIDVSINDFAKLIPSSSIRKKFFNYDSFKEKYVLKSDFINYVKLENVF